MIPARFIYLAGPIYGCDKGQAQDWRIDFMDRLETIGIRGINPLRCEPLLGVLYGHGDAADPRFGTAKAISAKNLFDVQNCDLTLAHFPYDLTERIGPSLGTVAEIAWAHALSKRTIVVSEHPKIVNHAVIQANTDWMLPTLDDAFDTIEGIITDYVKPIRSN